MKLEPMANVKYISIEGLDGVGKDTHTQALSDLLLSKGYNTYIAHHGYDTEYGRDIIRAIKSGVIKNPDAELAMLFSMWYLNILNIHRNIANGYKVNRTTHRRCYGTVVIFNRYIDSTYVYQVGLLGGNSELFRMLNEEMLNSFPIDYTIILTALPETALQRTQARPEEEFEDTKESLSVNNHQYMRDLYVEHMKGRNHDFISTELPIVEVQQLILDKVLANLKLS